LIHPARASLDKIIDGLMHWDNSSEPKSFMRHALVTSGLIASTWLIAIAIEDLSVVLSFVGATYASFLIVLEEALLFVM
jgi:amino acid permease